MPGIACTKIFWKICLKKLFLSFNFVIVQTILGIEGSFLQVATGVRLSNRFDYCPSWTDCFFAIL